jgi:transposase
MQGLEFDMALDKITFEQYLSGIAAGEDRIQRLEAAIQEVAGSEPYAEAVRKFRAFKGIVYLIALALVSVVGDFRRFPSAETFMSYLGLVPSEYSSGKKRRQGGITKRGNGHLRKLLTEAAWHYARPAQVSKRLAQRRLGTDEWTIAYADKALVRLHRKFTKLVFKGKSKNTAVTSVARELAGFVWGVLNRAS